MPLVKSPRVVTLVPSPMPGMKKLMALANGTAVSKKMEKVDKKVITKMLDTEGDIILEIGPKRKRLRVS